MKNAKKTPVALSKVCWLIEPGPVVLVTTAGGDQTNVMTMSWHTMHVWMQCGDDIAARRDRIPDRSGCGQKGLCQSRGSVGCSMIGS
jgi:hypothetical protein